MKGQGSGQDWPLACYVIRTKSRKIPLEVYMKRVSLIAALCVLLLPTLGLADTISFYGTTHGGSVSMNSGGVLTGMNIPINSINGVSGTITGGLLSFSGNLIADGTLLGYESVYLFSLSTFDISGGVPAAGIAPGS